MGQRLTAKRVDNRAFSALRRRQIRYGRVRNCNVTRGASYTDFPRNTREAHAR